MLQTEREEEMNTLYKLRCLGYAEVGDDIWFSNLNFNALMKLNKSSGRLQIVDTFPHYEIQRNWLYSTVHYINGQLIFIPCNSEEIAAYDIQSKEYSFTALRQDYLGKEGGHFLSLYAYGHYLYLFPARARCIVRYDVIDHSVKYLENELREVTVDFPEKTICFSRYEIVDEKICMPFLELNAVAVFDVRKESLEVKYLDIPGGCSTINYVNGKFYLASYERSEIYCWEEDTGKVKVYDEFPEGFRTGGEAFLYTYCTGNRLFLFPLLSNMIVSFDFDTGKIYEEQRVNSVDQETWNTWFVKTDGKVNTILLEERRDICSVCFRDGKLDIDPYFEQNALYNQRQISSYLLQHGYYDYYIENKGSLEDYLEILSDAEKSMTAADKRDNCGRNIYDALKSFTL